MKEALAAFDEACTILRSAYAECVRRRDIFDRRAKTLDKAWLDWLRDRNGPEPTRLEDDDMAQMLSAALDAANLQYEHDAHSLLLGGACVAGDVGATIDALKWWQSRALETLLPQIQTILGVPLRAGFSREYPECIQMFVSDDVDPEKMPQMGTMLFDASSGALRYCVNIVHGMKAFELCDSEGFDAGFAESWNCCVATVRGGKQ